MIRKRKLVLENTPSDIENLVDTGKDYLSMNYGRMCCLLWKCCQEQQSKIEHLESSVYELQEAMKELVKPKPKAKSKSQNINLYNINMGNYFNKEKKK